MTANTEQSTTNFLDKLSTVTLARAQLLLLHCQVSPFCRFTEFHYPNNGVVAAATFSF